MQDVFYVGMAVRYRIRNSVVTTCIMRPESSFDRANEEGMAAFDLQVVDGRTARLDLHTLNNHRGGLAVRAGTRPRDDGVADGEQRCLREPTADHEEPVPWRRFYRFAAR